MDISLNNCILAIICMEPEKVALSSCPVFVVKSREEQERTALILARVLGGIVHDLENGVYFVVRH